MSARLIPAALLWLAAAPALAQFSVHVTPPRFEDQARPGQTYRNIIEITNLANASVPLKFATADWRLAPDGSAEFSAGLQPGSCRPWVGIEAAQLVVPANGKRRYRFEVRVPADAPAGQCRFALMIEGEPQVAPGDVPVPVAGRIGVIVYLTVGDGAALLSVAGAGATEVAGQRLPVLSVHNAGNAHGRLEGFVDGVDAGGRKLTFAPGNAPVLPGATRGIPLFPVGEEDNPAPIAYPLTLRGRLDWRGQRMDIDLVVPR